MRPADRRDLYALFETVQRGGEAGYPDGEEPILIVGTGLTRLVFRGESERLLKDLQRRLARPGLSGGPLPKAVQSWLVQAVGRSSSEDNDQIAQWLDDQLDQPLREWSFFDPIRLSMPRERLRLGECEVFQAPPEELRIGLGDGRDIERFKLGVVRTRVSARDEESARLIADEAIDEAKAVLSMLGTRTWGPEREYAHRVSARAGLSVGGGESFYVRHCDPHGELWPGYSELVDAIAKDDRNEWERRVLSAARWWVRAKSAASPSQALVNSMVAFETIFVRDKSERDKGTTIAKRVTERTVLKGLKPKKQRKWLRMLYSERTDVSHEGSRYVDDLELVRLLDLLEWAVHWAVWHLGLWHLHSRYAPCSTFDEVMSPHLRSARDR